MIDATERLEARRASRPLAKELKALLAIAVREIVKVLKSPMYLVANLVVPVIFMGLVGGNLAQNMAGDLPFDFLPFVLVGMVVNTCLMTTVQGMCALVEERDLNLTQQLFVAPISRYSIILGRMLGASFTSVFGLAGLLLTALVMGINVTSGNLIGLIALTPLFCLVGASLGVFFIGFVSDSRTADMGSWLLIMPQMFLSGAIIPISDTTGILGFLAKLMPMTYAIDAARAVYFSGSPAYDWIVLHSRLLNWTVLAVVFVLFSVVGTVMFARAERNR